MQEVGRRFNSNTSRYQSDEYERLSDVKTEQRNKILNFILRNHPQIPIKYLGMPGKYWFIEKQLVDIDRMSRVAGVENNFKIYNNAKFMMPGPHKTIDKSKYINEHMKLDICVNNKSVYLFGNITGYTEDDIYKEVVEDSGTFKYGFTDRTVVWYDFTASFNEQTFRAIHNIKNVVCANTNSIICLTLLYGRDLYFNGKGEDARVEIVKTALPNFEVKDVWKYKGFNDSTMINICGILKNE